MDDKPIKASNNSIQLRIGEFTFRITSSISFVLDDIHKLYADFIKQNDNDTNKHFIDFEIKVDRPKNFRRWFKPQVCLTLNDTMPFKPLPVDHAFAMLEWGMNWCIANHAHHYLMFHSAVLEKNGKAIILPAPPGSGKSTLCAALAYNGWRLLSDEIAMVSLQDNLIYPVARPISLKNESIKIIKNFVPNVIMSKPAYDTHKGTVSLTKPPKDSVNRINEPCAPAFIIFPKYKANSIATLSKKIKGNSFIELADNSFNYHILGKEGFEATAKIIEQVDCYSFEYSDFDQAIIIFNELVQ
jgi:HprK-related kinase A